MPRLVESLRQRDHRTQHPKDDLHHAVCQANRMLQPHRDQLKSILRHSSFRLRIGNQAPKSIHTFARRVDATERHRPHLEWDQRLPSESANAFCFHRQDLRACELCVQVLHFREFRKKTFAIRPRDLHQSNRVHLDIPTASLQLQDLFPRKS